MRRSSCEKGQSDDQAVKYIKEHLRVNVSLYPGRDCSHLCGLREVLASVGIKAENICALRAATVTRRGEIAKNMIHSGSEYYLVSVKLS
jgi:hypothetical protein